MQSIHHFVSVSPPIARALNRQIHLKDIFVKPNKYAHINDCLINAINTFTSNFANTLFTVRLPKILHYTCMKTLLQAGTGVFKKLSIVIWKCFKIVQLIWLLASNKYLPPWNEEIRMSRDGENNKLSQVQCSPSGGHYIMNSAFSTVWVQTSFPRSRS